MQEYNKKFKGYTPELLLNSQPIEQSYLDKIKNIYENQGLKILLKKVTKNILSPIFMTNSSIWFERDLTKELTDYQPGFPVEFEASTIDKTIKWLKNQKQSWLVNQKEINTAKQFNHCWPYVKSNGKIIGCIKIGFDNVFVVDYKQVVKFPEKMAFIYDTYILDEQRGKGIGKYLISQTIKLLKSQGYTIVGCHIPPWNKISISAYEKMGFKKISYIRFFRILGVSIKKENKTEKILYV